MRLGTGGEIDRSASLRFRFDGIWYRGHPGDTLASALLANGITLVGRSFKYHRPRGIWSAGSEEPNALVTLGTGADQTPNLRATEIELFDGLAAWSQNAWPSLRWDALSVNDLAAPFLGAGFYYKTFMWPRAFWEKLYEPLIRRAAGLGRLSGEAAEDRSDKAYAFCDLLIIGAGPAGLAAAQVAAQAGADVILADEGTRPGGQILSSRDAAMQGWRAAVLAELSEAPNVRIMSRTTVTGAYDGGTFGAVERAGPDRPLHETFWRIVAKRSVLASGALERGIAFRNNDRPGVMAAGAIRTYLNRFGVSPGRAVTIFTNNDSAYAVADDLAAAGVHVAALIDARPDARQDTPTDRPYRVIPGAQVTNAAGRRRIESVTVNTAAGIERIATDCLGVSGGWNPALHLTCHMNGRPSWSEDLQTFVPVPGAVPGLTVAGACNGAFSTKAAMIEGQAVALAALATMDLSAPDIDLPEAEDAPYRIAPLWAVQGKGRAWLDLQNDVTVKDVAQAARENYASVEHMKRYTTQGMATDQGKTSNVAALAVLADATGRGIPETGTTTFRPPYSPIAISTLGAGAKGKGFAPERRTTSDAASRKMGAPMITAGLWYRPSYFPRDGEKTWRQSCDREVGHVREAVGVCDVSTLGKIDIQGADAGRFLDFVYTNTFSTLKVGRVRYGLMLREDGHVMDDGTTARLGENHYLMTTTTAAAGPVMQHLEFVAQTLCPDWDVHLMSVTEQWAQFAVAGPKARALLDGLLDAPLLPQDWPFMACGEVQIGGITGRLYRISFSGEHAYEIAVPARYGAHLFHHLVRAAEALGGGAYGMEALNVLRLEKGFITHSEIDGRVTAYDIGLGRMVSQKKDCIGKVMAARPGLTDSSRPRMVGIRPTGAVKQLTAGAHVFDAGDEATRLNSKGYVTSVGFSPTLGHFIGLAFVQGGPDRVGDTMRVVDHLRGVETQVEICSPVFFDVEGGRARD